MSDQYLIQINSEGFSHNLVSLDSEYVRTYSTSTQRNELTGVFQGYVVRKGFWRVTAVWKQLSMEDADNLFDIIHNSTTQRYMVSFLNPDTAGEIKEYFMYIPDGITFTNYSVTNNIYETGTYCDIQIVFEEI